MNLTRLKYLVDMMQEHLNSYEEGLTTEEETRAAVAMTAQQVIEESEIA